MCYDLCFCMCVYTYEYFVRTCVCVCAYVQFCVLLSFYSFFLPFWSAAGDAVLIFFARVVCRISCCRRGRADAKGLAVMVHFICSLWN